MIYFLLILLPIILIREIINYREPQYHIDPLIDVTERKIANKIVLIQQYYIEHYIGEERMKDIEWMNENGGGRQGRSSEPPVWRQYQIVNNPTTQEGLDFRMLMINYSSTFSDLRRDSDKLNPNYLSQLQKLNEEADKLFPKVFISIKRDEKLNELI